MDQKLGGQQLIVIGIFIHIDIPLFKSSVKKKLCSVQSGLCQTDIIQLYASIQMIHLLQQLLYNDQSHKILIINTRLNSSYVPTCCNHKLDPNSSILKHFVSFFIMSSTSNCSWSPKYPLTHCKCSS